MLIIFLIAGPCVVENETITNEVATIVTEICRKLQIPYVFKASYKKANRTSSNSFTGIGDIKALEIIKHIGEKYKVPTTTDVHTAEECVMAAKYVDILQIPAFLCRQTDLLLAAVETGKIVNVKKGQFLSGESMKFVVEKIKPVNDKIMLTERVYCPPNLVQTCLRVKLFFLSSFQGFCIPKTDVVFRCCKIENTVLILCTILIRQQVL